MKNWFTVARTTGLLYLGLAVAGAVGYLMAGSQIYVEGDAQATLTNIIDNPGLARLSLLGDLGVVLFQALVALWFFKLFKKVNSFAAGAIAVFGLINAIIILVGLAFSNVAVQLALGGGDSETVHLLWDLHQSAWGIGSLFFGLWLIPMGYLVIRAKMPKLLGWILYAGGVGYILSTIVYLASPSSTEIIEGLPLFASIGELWIVLHLLSKPELPTK